jgi:hypothetical protein
MTFGVIKKDKELLLFPLIGVILSVGWIAALVYPFWMLYSEADGSYEAGAVEVILTFILYLGLAFIGTFTKFCVTFTSKTRFEGGDATFGESIKFTLGKTHLVLGWATVSATVGLFFLALDNLAEKLGAVGEVIVSIIRGLLGLAWTAINLFVVPAMIYEEVGPMDAIKTSANVLKKTWGEAIVKHFGFGLIAFGFYMLGGGLTWALGQVFYEGNLVWITIGFAAFYFSFIALLFSVADSVFNTALYAYAATERVPEGWREETLMGAFRHKD